MSVAAAKNVEIYSRQQGSLLRVLTFYDSMLLQFTTGMLLQRHLLLHLTRQVLQYTTIVITNHDITFHDSTTTPIHWLVHGQVTSDENYDVKRETVHCYPRNVARFCT